MGPLASGYAMPLLPSHGSAQSVIVCQMPLPSGASRLSKVIDCPCLIVGTDVAMLMSPLAYAKLLMSIT